MKRKPLYRRTIIATAKTDYSKIPLTITAIEDSTVSFSDYRSLTNGQNLAYSMDGNSWTDVIFDETVIQLPKGKSLFISGDNPTGTGPDYPNDMEDGYPFIYGTGLVDVSGNIMSLISRDMTAPLDGNFQGLFTGDITKSDLGRVQLPIRSAKNLILPKTITEDCYFQLFSGNTSIEESPLLQANDEYHGYYAAFDGCTNLKKITVAFTEWYAGGTDAWVGGVAASGTFICPEALPKEFGTSKIPTGWTVVTK